MKNILRPDEKIERFDKFDIKGHLDKGFKLILLDIDNTIDVPDVLRVGSKEAHDYIDYLIESGFEVVLFSNNYKKRVKAFIGDKNYNYHYWALKPLPFSYLYIMVKYKLKPNQIISIGDQLLTDLIGANLCGIYTIYSNRYQEKDSFTTSINRKIERFIFKYITHEEM